MKRLIIIAAVFATATMGFSQGGKMISKGGAPEAAVAQVTVQEAMQTMSKGQQNSFTIVLPTDDQKMARDVWKETMKAYKAKTKKKGGELVSVTEKMTDLASGETTVYAKFEENELSIWFENGGTFIASETHDGSFTFIEELFNDYNFNLNRAMAAQKVEDEEKALKGLNKNLEKLEKENKQLHETIEKAKAMIADAEQGIEANLKSQEAKQDEIEAQTKAVKDAKNAEAAITRFQKKQ